MKVYLAGENGKKKILELYESISCIRRNKNPLQELCRLDRQTDRQPDRQIDRRGNGSTFGRRVPVRRKTTIA
jgi:ribosomal protein L4